MPPACCFDGEVLVEGEKEQMERAEGKERKP